MGIKKTFASLKEAFLNAVTLPAARAADALIAENPAFADKLKRAKDIIQKDHAVLANYLPRPYMMVAPVGLAYTLSPLPPSAYELLGKMAEREQMIDGCSYKEGIKRAVEKTCAAGRQLQNESDVRAQYPALFKAPDSKPSPF